MAEFGKLQGVFGVSPSFLQRAAIVSMLSFVFFLLMMFGFYLRQNIGYFLLATAFLAVNVLTLVGWISIRRRTVRVYEKGLRYRDFDAFWSEIESVDFEGGALRIMKSGGVSVELPKTVDRLDAIARLIESRVND